MIAEICDALRMQSRLITQQLEIYERVGLTNLHTFNIYIFSVKFLQKHTHTTVTMSQRKFNDLGMIVLIKKIIYTIEIAG